MKQTVITSVIFMSSVLFYALSLWYETEHEKLLLINKEHTRDIRTLREIREINKWLEKDIEPFLQALPKDTSSSNDQLVLFFDRYSQLFDFKVEKYIYEDEFTQNLDISFSITRENKKDLRKLMQLKYKGGYIEFKNFKITDKKITGILQLVQPMQKEDTNASE